MEFIFLATSILFVGAQPGTAPWYVENAQEALKKAKSQQRNEAMRIVDEMRKEADKKNSQQWQMWVEWKKGQCEYYLGNLSQAIASYEKVALVKDFPLRHNITRDLGEAHLDSGNPGKAEGYFKEALAAQKFDPDESVRISLRLIQSQLALTKITEARKGLAAERKKLDGIQPAIPAERWTCLDAGWNLLQAGLDLEARNPLRALARLDASQQRLKSVKQDPELATEALDMRFRCHLGLAADYWLVGRYADADAQLAQAEAIVPAVASQRNLASMKNARAALIIERSSLALEGEFQPQILLDDLEKASAFLHAALGHLKKAGSGADLLTTTVEYQIGQAHELRGRVLDSQGNRKEARVEYQAAKDRCETTLAWRDKTFKPDHDLVLEARTMRAWLNLRLGDNKAAQQEAADTLQRFDDSHKKDDLDRGRILHVLFEAENKLGNLPAALKYAQEHRRLVDDGLGSLVAGLSPAEQIQFFHRWDSPGLSASLRIGLQHAQKDHQAAEASLEWLINGKAKLAEVVATQTKAARLADRQDFAKFQNAVKRQAYLMYNEPAPDPDALLNLQREFLIEESRKRDLAEIAAKQFPPKARWYTCKDIRTALRPDEIYVGVYALPALDGTPRSYHAWMLNREGPVQIVNLGPADAIDSLVKIFVREQERAPLIAPGDEKNAEQYLKRVCLEELSRLVLHPLLKPAGGAKRWVVSPDGPLWNVPWATLLLPSDDYAIAELTFRYAVSGQDLVPDSFAAADGEPLVLGDPWFNHPDADQQRLRRPGLDPLRLPWDRLENSRRECEVVLAILQESKLKPKGLFGAVKKSDLIDVPRAPRIVYLSTHAYATLPSRVQADDPLLSCALAFAGWNQRAGAGDSSLPGLMTGAELLGIDLRGTELVVLASCAAGRETFSYGRSPVNLRHAFHLAGARAVVAPLWSMNDRATLDLMAPFMESIGQQREDKALALREAQQQSMRYLRLYRNHSHPFYWAGFTITGS